MSRIMFIAPLAALLGLSACQNADVFGKNEITVNNKSSVASDSAAASASADNLPSMTRKLSGGSVEIYDLDAGDVMGAGTPAVEQDYIGIPMATDPRVIVYPLDGDTSGTYIPQVPNYTPAPISGDMTSSYTPQSYAGTMESDIERGVLSPRVGKDISSIYFAYGSATLNGAARTALVDVAETAKFAPVDRVSIEGFASRAAQTSDPIKAKILNLKESMNRAQSVTQNLIENGVPPEKIKTTAWGDTKPAAGGEAANRRVDIVTGLGGGQ